MENKLIYEEVELVLLNDSHKTLLLSWLTDKRVLAFWEGEDEVFDAVRIEENFYSSEDFDMTRFIIKYNDECVGYLQAYILSDEMKKEYEYLGKEVCAATDCFIGKPEQWGKGIGYKAMKLAKDFLFKKGAQSILIDPHVDNARAIRCYEKVGFEKVKVLYKHELHNKKYVDCYLMKCELKA